MLNLMKNLIGVVVLLMVVFGGFKIVEIVLEKQRPATILSEKRIGDNSLIEIIFKENVNVKSFTVGECKVISPVESKAYKKGDYVAIEFTCKDYRKRNYQLAINAANDKGYLYY